MNSMKKRFSRHTVSGIALIAGIGASGCASAPPQQLRDARASYAFAASGPAGRLTPAELVDAKKALDSAERSFDDDGASPETIDASYVAQRRAQIADARGQAAQADAEGLDGKARLAKLREQHLSDTERDLAHSRGEVARGREQLAMTGAELAATGLALAEKKSALADEKKARADSERRLQDAMTKLALAASLSVKDEARGTVITLPGNVMFGTAKSALLPGAKSKLDAVAVALKDQPDTTITVEGHTDSQGTPESNVALADRRAKSVRDYLQSKGVPNDHLISDGIGESRPIGDNTTAQGRAQNRRVEIIVTPREKR